MPSIQKFFEIGDFYFKRSYGSEAVQEGKPAAGLAGKNFWIAFVLGHPQAALPLAICFTEGRGVKKDVHIGQLFFSVAELLGDERCADYKDIIIVPTSMDEKVNALYNAFDEARIKFAPQMKSNTEIEISTIDSQFDYFAKYFRLDHGTIQDYFINYGEAKPTEAASHYHHYEAKHSESMPLSGADDNSDCCSGCVIF